MKNLRRDWIEFWYTYEDGFYCQFNWQRLFNIVVAISFILLFTCQATQAQLNLHADSYRIRTYSKTTKSWSAWDTLSCDVSINVAPDFDQIVVDNALKQTLSIRLSDNGRYYNAVDYEGFSLAVVIYHNPDNTYNVLFHYDKVRLYYKETIVVSYAYQYLHCKRKMPHLI